MQTRSFIARKGKIKISELDILFDKRNQIYIDRNNLNLLRVNVTYNA